MKQYIGFSRDHSASMCSISRSTAKDYNDNIQSIQQNAKEFDVDTIVSVIKCGVGSAAKNEYEVINSNVQVLNPIELSSYVADGHATPLWDSVGMLIDQMAAVPDAGNKDVSFMVMVITDVEDNASRAWNSHTIATKMQELQATDRWSFIFRVPRGSKRRLESLGIPAGNILEWEQTAQGVEKATVATTSAFREFYSTRAAGQTATQNFYADLSKVTLAEVKKNLVDISQDVHLFTVDSQFNDMQISDFVELQTGKGYTKGCAYYELTKTETVQPSKEIAIRDKLRGAIYSGVGARDMLGLPQNAGNIKLSPQDHKMYQIYIQSTSVNRKLKSGTKILVKNEQNV